MFLVRVFIVCIIVSCVMLVIRKDSIKLVFIYYIGYYIVLLTKLDKGNYRVIIEKKNI